MSSKGQATLASLNSLLEKTSNWDKDERYMATNDLCALLSNPPPTLKIDDYMEQKICTAILKQLDDQSNDVQSVAVKCLAIIIKKVKIAQIGEICKKLSSLILDGKDALRDIYSIGLKTLIADVPDSMGPSVIEMLSTRLLGGILNTASSEEVKRECLDITADLLRRFGHLANEQRQGEILSAVIKQLQHDKPVIRKKAAHCLGSLAVVSSDALLHSMVHTLLGQIESSSATSASTRTLIQTIGTVSRTVGFRLGKHLPRIVPLFLQHCGSPSSSQDESQYNDASNELRESCFPGLESFVARCPREVAPFLQSIVQVAVGFVAYDPNFAGDEDEVDGDEKEDEGEEMEVEEQEDDEAEDEEEYGGGSDDDDTSWKVRKAAVKVLAAVVNSACTSSLDGDHLLRGLLYQPWCVDAVIARMSREREENVRLDVLQCFTSLVQATGRLATTAATSTSISSDKSSGEDLRTLLARKVGRIMAACFALLAGPSVKTKSAVLLLLRAVIATLHGGLERYLVKLLAQVDRCLVDGSQALKLDALLLLRDCVELHPPASVQGPLLTSSRLLPRLVGAVRDDWYKVIAEALRVLAAVVGAVRPSPDSCYFADIASGDCQAFVSCVYDAIYSRLDALDIDREIKDCAISGVGKLVSHFGDCPALTPQLPGLFALLQRRLENETTRSAAMRAVAAIASSTHPPSPLSTNLAGLLDGTAGDLALFLRQTSRNLKQLALQALDALLLAPSTCLSASVCAVVAQEAAGLLTDGDLHLAQLTLSLLHSLLLKAEATHQQAVAAEPVRGHVYPRMLQLARSPLLSGQALQAKLRLFQSLTRTLTASGAAQQNFFNEVIADLYGSSPSASVSKHGLSNLSKCIAAVCLCDCIAAPLREQFLLRLVADVEANSESTQQLALLSLGEVGQHSPLLWRVVRAGSGQDLQELLLQCFLSAKLSDDVKQAAAYCLGHVAAGSMDTFLPAILQALPHGKQPQQKEALSQQEQQQQYLLLAALRDAISVHAACERDFHLHAPAVLPVLLEQCEEGAGEAAEESVKNIVAECLGLLTSMPGMAADVIPTLLALTQPAAGQRGGGKIVANTLKVALARPQSPAAEPLAAVMGQFLPLLENSDLEVKRAALLMVNTAIHHNPSVVAAFLSRPITPVLLETLRVKMERVVDLGPFKHKVDDNLPLRKVALTCVESVLDSPLLQIDAEAVMAVMPTALADKEDIKLQAHQVLVKLAQYGPAAVAAGLDSLIDPLDRTAMKKLPTQTPPAGSNADNNAMQSHTNAPEHERALELVRSAVKVIATLNRITADAGAAGISVRWQEFVKKVKLSELTASHFQLAVEADRKTLIDSSAY